MEFSRLSNFFIVAIMFEALLAGVSFVVQDEPSLYIQPAAVSASASATLSVAARTLSVPQKLSNPPQIVKAVYVTGYSAGTKKYLNYLANLFKTTEINAVVVDIKDYSGMVSYDSDADNVKKYNLYNNAITDIDSLMRFFHDQNIYVIGRIAVFEDPGFAKSRPDLAVYDKTLWQAAPGEPRLWRDNHALAWMDPSSKEVWDYNISLAKDAFYHGFDEINFDYVRFPSDGKVENMGFPVWDGLVSRADTIKKFFQYVRFNLAGKKISVDLFGQTTINTNDLGIGQIIENAFENFNYISPMVYPSHYIKNFMDFSNSAEHPYEVVKYSMETAQAREIAFSVSKNDVPYLIKSPLADLRPWLQDFDMGADYTADMVRAQIKATKDGLGKYYSGYMLWNPSNIYSVGAAQK